MEKQLKRIIRARRSVVTNYLWIQLSMTEQRGANEKSVGGGRWQAEAIARRGWAQTQAVAGS